MTTRTVKRRTTREPRTSGFERSYRTALKAHVKAGRSSGAGHRIGRRAGRLGVQALALARIHERAATALSLPGAGASSRSASADARAEAFFAETVAASEGARRGAPEALLAAKRTSALLGRRTAELGVARARISALQAELAQRVREHAELVERSRLTELRMRRISHRLLSAQEEERLRISRDLHDAIGQTLTGINVGLASLKSDAAADSRELAEAISQAQKLVERSMKTVHQFAWELRPTLLDDLGLVPALRSYAKMFSERTGVAVLFKADPKSDRLDRDRSTALFRVTQGALSNVERHARADHAQVTLRALPGAVRLEVTDDGRSFAVPRMEASKTNRHLGLLVMRERIEMVGGHLTIESSPGRGTTVRAEVPLRAVTRD